MGKNFFEIKYHFQSSFYFLWGSSTLYYLLVQLYNLQIKMNDLTF